MSTSLDELIDEITTDAYGDEGYWAFLTAFDDAVAFPTKAKLFGDPVEVVKIDFDGDERRGLIATITRNGQRARLSLPDLAFPPRSTASRYQAAYRKWLGGA